MKYLLGSSYSVCVKIPSRLIESRYMSVFF